MAHCPTCGSLQPGVCHAVKLGDVFLPCTDAFHFLGGIPVAALPSLQLGWRCFHCDEYFTPDQRVHAEAHFGCDESKTPVCLMRMPGENELLAALRRAERELDSRREDIDPLINAHYGLLAHMGVKVRQAEEDGYAKGLRDRSDIKLAPEAFQPDDDSPGLYLRFGTTQERGYVMRMLGAPDTVPGATS